MEILITPVAVVALACFIGGLLFGWRAIKLQIAYAGEIPAEVALGRVYLALFALRPPTDPADKAFVAYREAFKAQALRCILCAMALIVCIYALNWLSN